MCTERRHNLKMFIRFPLEIVSKNIFSYLSLVDLCRCTSVDINFCKTTRPWRTTITTRIRKVVRTLDLTDGIKRLCWMIGGAFASAKYSMFLTVRNRGKKLSPMVSHLLEDLVPPLVSKKWWLCLHHFLLLKSMDSTVTCTQLNSWIVLWILFAEVRILRPKFDDVNWDILSTEYYNPHHIVNIPIPSVWDIGSDVFEARTGIDDGCSTLSHKRRFCLNIVIQIVIDMIASQDQRFYWYCVLKPNMNPLKRRKSLVTLFVAVRLLTIGSGIH